MLLLMWYLVLCFVAMPLDSQLAKRHKWFAPPVLTILYLIGSALFLRPSVSDVTETHAAAAAFRAWPVEWQMIIGVIICAPILWQASKAQQAWREQRIRKEKLQ